MNTPFKISFLLILLIFFSCDKKKDEIIPEEEFIPQLSATPSTLNFDQNGGTVSVSITSNTTWYIHYSTDWCRPSIQTTKGNANVTITSDANTVETERIATFTISAEGIEDVVISISQDAKDAEPTVPEIPEYIAPDMTGMADDAKTMASKMFLGWNLVNTLEAIGGETAWGNPKATEELILAVKTAGFNAVRIPCSWNQYLENQTTYKIKDSWLARVKEVVDYCVENDMYVVLNIHWDGGWMENNCTLDKQTEVNNKLAIIWKQIALYFRDYEEHLLFAGANEPNADNQEEVNVLNVYMQTFVDVVRATGGRNSYRNLIVQAPNTDIDLADTYITLPQDEIENRLFAEVHYYTPWNFCGLEADANWGKMFYFWGDPNHVEGADSRNANWGEEVYLINQFSKMKSKLVDKGVPVILGEFGAFSRDLSLYGELWQQKHNESRAYFNKTVAREAKNNGLIPFCWDNGIFNRNNNTVSDSLVYNGLIEGANAGTYPFQ